MNNISLSDSSKRVIKKLKDHVSPKDLHSLSVEDARKEFSRIRKHFSYRKQIELLKVENFKINNIPIRYYRGKNNSVNEILPIMIYFHGGGWVLGDLETHDQVCRKLVEKSKYDILSVDYNLAPKAIFPEAIEECRKLINSIIELDLKIKIDTNKIILCGDSAGANFATVLASYNEGNIKGQVLIYPATHMFSSYPSKEKYDGLILNKKLMEWFENHYVPKNIRRKYYDDIRLSPIKNEKFKNFPDTFIILAECDPLYDEGLLYGKKLKKNKVDAEIKVYKGLMHGFLTMGGEVEEVNLVVEDINKKISKYLQNS